MAASSFNAADRVHVVQFRGVCLPTVSLHRCLAALVACSFAAASAAAAAAAAAAPPAYHVVASIAGPDGPWDYARVDQTHHRLLVARGQGVMAVDLKSQKVTSGWAAGLREHIALPVAADRELLVTDGGADAAIFVDANSGAEIARVAAGKGPDAAAYDPASHTALVVDHAGGQVTLVDVTTHKALGAIDVGGELEELVLDGRGHAFVNVESRNEIAMIDIAGRRTSARYPLAGCDGPTGLAYDAADGLLIAACDGATLLVRAKDGHVLQTLPTGKGADGAAFDPVRRVAFVPAGRDGVLNVIAISHGRGEIRQKVPTQLGARTLALDEHDGRVYLPAARYAPGAVASERPKPLPGSFSVLVVAP
jgi:DNA-binding beta-propeller fold protein YncE